MRKKFPTKHEKVDQEMVEEAAFDFASDLSIDRDSLDDEWLWQPRLFMRYAEASATAARKVEKIEEEMKILRSDLILEANENPDLIPGGKVTAQIVEAYFRTRSDHKEVKQRLIKARYRADILDKAVRAFYQRKEALENLVRLHGQQYFATPAEPSGQEGDPSDRVMGAAARKIREHQQELGRKDGEIPQWRR